MATHGGDGEHDGVKEAPTSTTTVIGICGNANCGGAVDGQHTANFTFPGTSARHVTHV